MTALYPQPRPQLRIHWRTPITMVVLDHVPDGLVGIASGVFNTGRQLGGALSVGVFGVMLAGSDGSGRDVRDCLMTGAVVVLLASASAFRLPSE